MSIPNRDRVGAPTLAPRKIAHDAQAGGTNPGMCCSAVETPRWGGEASALAEEWAGAQQELNRTMTFAQRVGERIYVTQMWLLRAQRRVRAMRWLRRSKWRVIKARSGSSSPSRWNTAKHRPTRKEFQELTQVRAAQGRHRCICSPTN